MKLKILYIIISMFFSSSFIFASVSQNAVEFFKQYENYANNYNEELLNMYSPEVKIIREVVKPTGETVDVVIPAKRFFKELKIGQKTAKLRKYKNKYRNVTVQEISDGIKITAERQPAKENYWLKMYQIVQKTDSGFKIKEEMMQTKVQSFLRHIDKGE
uniref:DUF4440 domain-containing protein n=1 Tax=uncultured Candidatus Melainabacteria bacterium TaxID=2682970 RepID=A0A650EKG3_9BACT|nr:hypothetical protein Melaina855_0980 [uncultured Candidatus Melainabacteria bacterium]